MQKKSVYSDAGMFALALRWVVGWTYFSAFWRRTVLVNKLDPEQAGYIGEKFNHFLPNALGIKPNIQYLVENPEALWFSMVLFTVIEGLVGLFMILGMFTRLMSIGVFGLAMGILLGSGWIGTTCLDEWQIGVLGVATGFVLFLTGSGRFSIDHYWMQKQLAFTQKKGFAWLGSGTLPFTEKRLPRLVLVGSVFILGLTLFTNQVYHGGVWGTLHNKSVKPHLELSNTQLTQEMVAFDVYRTEGVDVYGSWVIAIELFNQQKEPVLQYYQEDLAILAPSSIENKYIAKVRPGKHSLIVPLGAKARITLPLEVKTELTKGEYTLKITDISGAYWEHSLRY